MSRRRRKFGARGKGAMEVALPVGSPGDQSNSPQMYSMRRPQHHQDQDEGKRKKGARDKRKAKRAKERKDGKGAMGKEKGAKERRKGQRARGKRHKGHRKRMAA